MALGREILIISTYLLAVARITRLINADTILDPLRIIPANKSHIARNTANDAKRSGQHSTAALYAVQARRWSTLLYFIECPWCVSIWVAFGTVWLPMFFADNRVVQYVGFALAASHLVGVFAFAADTEEMDVVEGDD